MVEEVMGATITMQIGREIVWGIFGMLTGEKLSIRSGGLFGFFKKIFQQFISKIIILADYETNVINIGSRNGKPLRKYEAN
ncbi:MAG: hypothetical protein H7325_05345 [Pedobacter sp.]|nr:hypothetical protein [Pedobacter sp.]